MASVKLRIVGTYFGAKKGVTKEVTVNNIPPNASVKKILERASEPYNYDGHNFPNGVENFEFSEDGSGKHLKMVRVTYNTSPIASMPIDGHPPFVFELEDSPNRGLPIGTAWQYYIYKKTEFGQVQVNFQTAFLDFITPNPFEVQWADGDEYTVVYRLVTIRRKPG